MPEIKFEDGFLVVEDDSDSEIDESEINEDDDFENSI